MSTYTVADDPPTADGRAVVLLRNETSDPRRAAVAVDGAETVMRTADLTPGESGVVVAPAADRVTAAVHTADASASLSFDPRADSVPPLFALRPGRVLVSPE